MSNTIASGYNVDGTSITAVNNVIAFNQNNGYTFSSSQTFNGGMTTPNIYSPSLTGLYIGIQSTLQIQSTSTGENSINFTDIHGNIKWESATSGGTQDRAIPATSTTTLTNPNIDSTIGQYWNGSQSVMYGFSTYCVMDSTTPTAHYSINTNLNNGTLTEIATINQNGIISCAGIKTTAGASTTVSAGASPYTYTNSSASNQQVFIQGGTVSAISFNPNGVSGISLSGLTDNVLTMRPNDTITITYTSAPTITTIQL